MNELEPATKKILLEYGIEDKEFQPEVGFLLVLCTTIRVHT